MLKSTWIMAHRAAPDQCNQPVQSLMRLTKVIGFLGPPACKLIA